MGFPRELRLHGSPEDFGKTSEASGARGGDSLRELRSLEEAGSILAGTFEQNLTGYFGPKVSGDADGSNWSIWGLSGDGIPSCSGGNSPEAQGVQGAWAFGYCSFCCFYRYPSSRGRSLRGSPRD